MFPKFLQGLACAWKIAATVAILNAPKAVYYAIALGAAVLYVMWLFMYSAKMIMYPRKASKLNQIMPSESPCMIE